MIETKSLIEKELRDSIDVKGAIIKSEEALIDIEKIATSIIDCYKKGGKVFFFGNGGSAADSQHLAAELVSKFKLERSGLPALALNANTSILTAIGNDYGYDRVFARQIEALCVRSDVAIGISTSGNSGNVLSALKAAKEIGATTIGFTGQSAGKMAELCDYTFRAPSLETPRIQEAHITVGHIICGLVEQEIFSK